MKPLTNRVEVYWSWPPRWGWGGGARDDLVMFVLNLRVFLEDEIPKMSPGSRKINPGLDTDTLILRRFPLSSCDWNPDSAASGLVWPVASRREVYFPRNTVDGSSSVLPQLFVSSAALNGPTNGDVRDRVKIHFCFIEKTYLLCEKVGWFSSPSNCGLMSFDAECAPPGGIIPPNTLPNFTTLFSFLGKFPFIFRG